MLDQAQRLVRQPLNEVIAKVPNTRLDDHPQINTDPETRVRHARGQSLPDWLEMHSGNVDTFPDGVAFPESSEQVRELLAHAKENHLVVIPYGGGTSVVGHINPETSDKPVLTIDMGKMNSMLSIDTESQLAIFGAGTPGPIVEEELKKHGYTLRSFPSILGAIYLRRMGGKSIKWPTITSLWTHRKYVCWGQH